MAADRLRVRDRRARRVGGDAASARRDARVATSVCSCSPDATDAMTQACFTETSTLGLRWREERRRVLRRPRSPRVDGADVTVKVAQRPGGKRTGKAAHDDVAASDGLGARAASARGGEAHARTKRARASERADRAQRPRLVAALDRHPRARASPSAAASTR